MATSFFITSISAAITGAIFLAAFTSHAIVVKNQLEDAKLHDLAELISREAVKALTTADASNLYANVTLNLPPTIGTKSYWVKFNNDTQQAWIDLGLGDTVTSKGQLRYYLPFQASASGTFRSSYGQAFLLTTKVGGTSTIKIQEKLT